MSLTSWPISRELAKEELAYICIESNSCVPSPFLQKVIKIIFNWLSNSGTAVNLDDQVVYEMASSHGHSRKPYKQEDEHILFHEEWETQFCVIKIKTTCV